MGVFDKVPPGGTFRAPISADFAGTRGRVYGVTLNASGQAVVGGAMATGTVRGVTVIRGIQQPYYPGQTATYRTAKAGEIIDVMKDGEIVEIDATDLSSPVAGGIVYVDNAAGGLTMTATSNQAIGHLIETTRLRVRVTP